MSIYLYTNEWLPWSNTLAYYPLTSVTTTSDRSWNSYTLTNNAVTFWVNQWVDCAYFWQNGGTKLVNTSISFSANPTQTVAVRMYIETPQVRYETIYHIGTSTWNWWLGSRYNKNLWLCIWEWDTSYESVKSGDLSNAWHLLVNTTNWNSSIQYIDWVQYQTLTNNLPNAQTWLYIGCSYSDTNHQLTWCLSNLIIENKTRTAQEVADYYNQTKGNYGVS